jgi:hypothetical protein
MRTRTKSQEHGKILMERTEEMRLNLNDNVCKKAL